MEEPMTEENKALVPEIMDEHEGSLNDLENVVWPEIDDEPTNDLRVLTNKAESALRVYILTGDGPGDVARAVGYSVSRFSTIIHSEAGQIYIQRLKAGVEEDFKSLFGKVTAVLRTGLDNPDPNTNLQACNLWLRHNLKFNVEVSMSAEDIVQQLIKQATEADAEDNTHKANDRDSLSNS